MAVFIAAMSAAGGADDATLAWLPSFGIDLASTPPFLPARSGAVDRVLVRKTERHRYLLRNGVPLRDDPIALGFRSVGYKVR